MAIELRIIAGKYKNRAIRMKNNNVRPTLIRARRIIFDTITQYLNKDFTFLDAFAGSGIMGIEALSRNASKVIFFDIDSKNIKAIENNLKEMDKIEGMYSCIKTNTLKPPKGTPVNIVFIDPNYNKSYIVPDVVRNLEKYSWIDQKTYLVIETSKNIKYQLPDKWIVWKEVSLGSESIIKFYYHEREGE